ncbi:MAG: hypothetical protein COB02_05675 [Candidatus Cloacimonadota bacterium]|nr:MAG: hypothetical protein COB02_05675 [Candidatus Cloacimonadota bacterium]
MKICIVTLEHINRDYTISGGALRVLGLNFLLEKIGHEVLILRKSSDVVAKDGIITFDLANAEKNGLIKTDLNEKINNIQADLLIVEQWGLLEWFDVDVPVIVDLHGSLIWENYYKSYQSDEQLRAKIICLSKADGIIVPGQRQYYYFMAWAQMSGLQEISKRLKIVPLILDDSIYKNENICHNDTIVMGGATWPWVHQLSKESLSKYLTDQKLNLYSKFYSPNESKLCPSNESKKTSNIGVAHHTLIKEYTKSLAAFDLYELNMERKLAITTRSIEYLYCGLPLIYSEGLELSDWIKKNDLGIILKDPKMIYEIDSLKVILENKKLKVQKFLRENSFLDKALENLTCILKLSKKKNTLSYITKVEKERREYRKQVGELKSMQTVKKTCSKYSSFYEKLWFEDMKDIYKGTTK